MHSFNRTRQSTKKQNDTKNHLKQFQLILFFYMPSTGYTSDPYHALDKQYVGYSEEETGLANFGQPDYLIVEKGKESFLYTSV